jgi:hypothetical protein
MHSILCKVKHGIEVFEIWFFPAYNYGTHKVSETRSFEAAVRLVNELNGGWYHP